MVCKCSRILHSVDHRVGIQVRHKKIIKKKNFKRFLFPLQPFIFCLFIYFFYFYRGRRRNIVLTNLSSTFYFLMSFFDYHVCQMQCKKTPSNTFIYKHWILIRYFFVYLNVLISASEKSRCNVTWQVQPWTHKSSVYFFVLNI